MHEDKRAGDVGCPQRFVCGGAGTFGKGEARFGGRTVTVHEVEIVIDGVPLAHGRIGETIVGERADFRAFYPCESGALFRPRGRDGEGGAVAPGEVDAQIPRSREHLLPRRKSTSAPEHDTGADGVDRAEQRRASGRDGERDDRVRVRCAEGTQGRRGEDQIADALELEDEDSHHAIMFADAHPSPRDTPPAAARENAPT